jgi:hypothetical protein
MTKTEKGNLYSQPKSMLRILSEFAGQWIRVKYVKEILSYQAVPMAVPTEPRFPDLAMAEIVVKAFDDRIISSKDHPILKDQGIV